MKKLDINITFFCESQAEAMFFATSLQDVQHYENVVTGLSITAPLGFCFSSSVVEETRDRWMCVAVLGEGAGNKRVTDLDTRRLDMISITSLFEEIGHAIAKIEAEAEPKSPRREGAADCLRAVAIIRRRVLGA